MGAKAKRVKAPTQALFEGTPVTLCSLSTIQITFIHNNIVAGKDISAKFEEAVDTPLIKLLWLSTTLSTRLPSFSECSMLLEAFRRHRLQGE